MVCVKCQRTLNQTSLATPSVKRKSEMYYGSPAGDKKRAAGSGAATTAAGGSGAGGVGKSKLLSKAAKNPYAAYSNACETCKTKIGQGHKYCQRCAYKRGNACSVCGKAQNSASSGAASTRGPISTGQKFSAK